MKVELVEEYMSTPEGAAEGVERVTRGVIVGSAWRVSE